MVSLLQGTSLSFSDFGDFPIFAVPSYTFDPVHEVYIYSIYLECTLHVYSVMSSMRHLCMWVYTRH